LPGAAYAFALARNHPYNDGNKRVALLAMLTFLAINGHDVEADDNDVLTTILALAAGRITESELAVWLRDRMVSIK
jgi:death on curing protein